MILVFSKLRRLPLVGNIRVLVKVGEQIHYECVSLVKLVTTSVFHSLIGFMGILKLQEDVAENRIHCLIQNVACWNLTFEYFSLQKLIYYASKKYKLLELKSSFYILT